MNALSTHLRLSTFLLDRARNMELPLDFGDEDPDHIQFTRLVEAGTRVCEGVTSFEEEDVREDARVQVSSLLRDGGNVKQFRQAVQLASSVGLTYGVDAPLLAALEAEVSRLERSEQEQRLQHELRHALQEALSMNEASALERAVHLASSIHKEDFKDGMPKSLEELLHQAREALHARKHSMVTNAQAASRANAEYHSTWSGKLRGEFGPRNGAKEYGRAKTSTAPSKSPSSHAPVSRSKTGVQSNSRSTTPTRALRE